MKSKIINIPVYKSFKYHRIYKFTDENISNENIIKKEEDIKNAKKSEKNKFQMCNDNKYLSINEILKEQNITNFNDSTFNENINYKNRNLIFLVHKRSHSNDKLESNNDSNKSVIYRKHDRNEKDNILTKIQIHYRNFLISFINEIIIIIIVNEYYNSRDIEKIKHLKEYLFNNTDQHFKSNIKKEFMKFAESNKIKDIISPSVTKCKKYNIENKNQKIMENVISLNNQILNNILNSEYLDYFDLYYNNKRNLILSGENLNLNLELSNNIKLFNDLANKYLDDEKYISNLKKFAELIFLKNVKKV
jgi:hypothetical protein